MKIREYISLIPIRLLVAWRNAIEFFRVVVCYYSDFSFLKLDFYLWRCYLMRGPFKIAKEFLIKKGAEDLYSYGETPLTAMDLIARECGLKKDDVVFELGSGRGRACFWLNHFIGCQVVGIEYIPEFVEIANRIKRKFKLKGIKFAAQDMLECNLQSATAIYFYGTCSDTDFILKLIDKLSHVPAGTKIITVSYPLTWYSTKPLFELVKVIPATFTWGTADVYLQIRVDEVD